MVPPSLDRAVAGSVSVVLPCLDEAGSVGLCVEEALLALKGADLVGEVIVVDNGSTDDSAAIAAAAGARVVREAVPGYGSALRAGFEAAKGDVVVMADADGTYELSRIPELVAPVRRGEADMTVGARLDAATRSSMPFLHRFVGTPALTFLVARACGGPTVTDSQSGFRAIRRDALAVLDLRSTGMELASEMLIRASRCGLRVTEIRAGYRDRIGESKLNTVVDGWRHLQLILLLAPDLLLVGPGLVLVAAGLLFTVLGLAGSDAIELGSLRWQPVFFAGIATVLGLQALLAGVVLANRSSLASRGARERFEFAGRPSFPGRCVAAGAFAILGGLAVDLVLSLQWLQGDPSGTDRGLGLTSLAQSLIIVGGTLVSFGLVSRLISSAETRPARWRSSESDPVHEGTPT